MDKLIRAYILLLLQIRKKLLLKEFDIWKMHCKLLFNLPQNAKKSTNKRLTHACSSEKFTKFKTMTEGALNAILEDGTQKPSNMFEELKLSLKHKALKNDGNIINVQETVQIHRSMHKKNTSASIYTIKGNRKNLIKSSLDTLESLAVVSSCSALSLRKDKVVSMFSVIKK
jgi:hypothetical protein